MLIERISLNLIDWNYLDTVALSFCLLTSMGEKSKVHEGLCRAETSFIVRSHIWIKKHPQLHFVIY